MKRLNLGCGFDIRKNWDNYDKYPISKHVKFIDLEQLPLPFQDKTYDYILLNHVFEHINVNRYSFFKEISRILKPNGTVKLAVPVNHQCFEHEQIFFTWDYFNKICSDEYGNLFKSITYETSNNCISSIFWKIKQFLFYILKHEIIYEFKK